MSTAIYKPLPQTSLPFGESTVGTLDSTATLCGSACLSPHKPSCQQAQTLELKTCVPRFTCRTCLILAATWQWRPAHEIQSLSQPCGWHCYPTFQSSVRKLLCLDLTPGLCDLKALCSFSLCHAVYMQHREKHVELNFPTCLVMVAKDMVRGEWQAVGSCLVGCWHSYRGADF